MSLLLVLTMLFSMMSALSITASAEETWEGQGTVDEPWLINTVADLKTLATKVNSGTDYAGKYFKLTADLDLNSIEKWTPIGGSHAFNGTFDGNGKTISNLTLPAQGSYGIDGRYYSGLFNYTGASAVVKNFKITNAKANNQTGFYNFGFVSAYNMGTIENVTVELGNYSGDKGLYFTDVNSTANIGAVVGTNASGGVVNGCNVSGKITGAKNSNQSPVGGIVGLNESNGLVINCSNEADVICTANPGTQNVGGIVGKNSGNIENCVNLGTVSGRDNIGGIAGYGGGKIQNCCNGGVTNNETGYTTPGSIAGTAYGTIDNCYGANGTAAQMRGGTTETTNLLPNTTKETLEAARDALKEYDKGDHVAMYKNWSYTEDDPCPKLTDAPDPIVLDGDPETGNTEVEVAGATLNAQSGAYEFTYTGEEVVIYKAAVEPNPEINLLTVTYNETTALVLGTDYVIVTDPADSSVLSATDVGDYKVTIKGIGKYDGTVVVDWKIVPAELTVTPNPKAKMVGQTDPALDYVVTGKIEGEEPSFAGALARESGETVGDYKILQGTLALADNDLFKAANYKIKFVENVVLTISEDLTSSNVSFTGATWNADAERWEYTYSGEEVVVYDGTTDPVTSKIVVKDGDKTLVEGTDYDVDAEATVGKATNADANGYAVKIVGKGDYSGTVETKWYIVPADLTVTPDTLSKDRGESDPELTYTYAGNVTGETPAFTGKLSRAAGEAVGDYKVTAGTLALADNGTFLTSNYNLIVDDTVVFTIKPVDTPSRPTRVVYVEVEKKECPRDETCPIDPYVDTLNDYWWHDGIHYCIENGLMLGTSKNIFSPNGIITRAEVVTILYRLEGKPAFRNDNIFPDVKAGSWYEKAVVWANGEDIVLGYSNGNFGPDDPITREQLAVILYRYAQYKDIDVSVDKDTNFLSFNDFMDISDYAKTAMMWAIENGLIEGSHWNLNPQGDASRAEAAAILQRYCEKIIK